MTAVLTQVRYNILMICLFIDTQKIYLLLLLLLMDFSPDLSFKCCPGSDLINYV